MRVATLLVVILLSGCSIPTRFTTLGKNHYQLHKLSSACVIGTEDGITSELWMEAARFCAARRERPEKISSEFEIGIPYIRCASVQLDYRCVPEVEKESKPIAKGGVS